MEVDQTVESISIQCLNISSTVSFYGLENNGFTRCSDIYLHIEGW